MKHLAAIAISLSLAACVGGEQLTGPAPSSFMTETIGVCPLACLYASATQITSSKAVTARHASLVAALNTHALQQADISWFANAGIAPTVRNPRDGEPVVLYGNWYGPGARVAKGHVIAAKGYIERGDHRDYGVIVDADAESGFSGGGIYGADGALLGVATDTMKLTDGRAAVFGYWASEIKGEIAP